MAVEHQGTCSGVKMFSGPENIHVKAHSEAPPDVIPDKIKFRHNPKHLYSQPLQYKFPYENSLTVLLYLVYIHKCKANKGQKQLQFIKGKKREVS